MSRSTPSLRPRAASWSPTASSTPALAAELSRCAATLDGLGPHTDRLQPVYDLAKAACAPYKKAADCFTTAAGYGITVSGSAEDRKQQAAITCGFTAPADGSRGFAEAEAKGIEIKASVR
ncbi:hypothetical protein Cs7R123_52450 [Catellatospora sp. TT07R-123]|uniref:hypothetical protein n=1 Tax=Catellatospora sp. TT07R-123 TaxID=2733863 RepID=UPI001B07BD7F|nr:hypothetical protein [Catellatospora sp. TT07R-123]GHJ47903.1 hypothetical protein Cs7R123_52450 [Catellatospora sp. TT07R-123]